MGEYADMEVDRAMADGDSWGHYPRLRDPIVRRSCATCGRQHLLYDGGLKDPDGRPHSCTLLSNGRLPKPSIL